MMTDKEAEAYNAMSLEAAEWRLAAKKLVSGLHTDSEYPDYIVDFDAAADLIALVESL